MPIDYEKEAALYDQTRGGEPRARAAAEAVLSLLPARDGKLADVGGGTGIVTRHLADAGFEVTTIDQSAAMLAVAEERLPGRCLRAPAHAIPVPDGAFDVVTCIWLLHLLKDSAPVIREVARLLRPGGIFVTTIDKAAAQGGSRPSPQDARNLVTAHAQAAGMEPIGTATFIGVGQEGSPTYTLLAARRR